MKQTAVEFLELMFLRIISFDSEIQRKKYKDVIRQAKEMEKQQLKSEQIAKEHFRQQRDEGLLEQSKMYTKNEVELIAIEMVNWALDSIGNPNPQSGKKFDEVLAKYKNK